MFTNLRTETVPKKRFARWGGGSRAGICVSENFMLVLQALPPGKITLDSLNFQRI
jgi:hypothetical protein